MLVQKQQYFTCDLLLAVVTFPRTTRYLLWLTIMPFTIRTFLYILEKKQFRKLITKMDFIIKHYVRKIEIRL